MMEMLHKGTPALLLLLYSVSYPFFISLIFRWTLKPDQGKATTVIYNFVCFFDSLENTPCLWCECKVPVQLHSIQMSPQQINYTHPKIQAHTHLHARTHEQNNYLQLPARKADDSSCTYNVMSFSTSSLSTRSCKAAVMYIISSQAALL